MNESSIEQNIGTNEKVLLPEWYANYVKILHDNKVDLEREIENVGKMSMEELNTHIGGRADELPYEVLGTLLIDGSDSEEVANLLRNKREKFLLNHPEMQKGRGASEGIITYDGRFISKEDWESASSSEKRGALVGSTCFHYNSGTPGMDSSPKDRW